MSDYVVKLPDVGEGVAEAEIVEWHVSVGDTDQRGRRARRRDDRQGDRRAAVTGGRGRPLARRRGRRHRRGRRRARPDRDRRPGRAERRRTRRAGRVAADRSPSRPPRGRARSAATTDRRARRRGGRRRRRRRCGRERRGSASTSPTVTGTGPDGRVVHEDLDDLLARRAPAPAPPRRVARDGGDEVEDVKVIGLRRNIAERMQASKRRIPHFTYVEEVDVTELEGLRGELNDGRPGHGSRCCRS